MISFSKNFVKFIIGTNRLRKLREIRIKTKISNNSELYSNVNNTAKFENLHTKERCFILVNRPSIGSVDLSRLTKEYVFTVNKICKLSGFELLKSNFHIWVDGAFFNLRKNHQFIIFV